MRIYLSSHIKQHVVLYIALTTNIAIKKYFVNEILDARKNVEEEIQCGASNSRVPIARDDCLFVRSMDK